MFISVIIPAAGNGRRMESTTKKQFLQLNNKEILAITIDIFEKHALIDEIIIVTNSEDIDFVSENIINKYAFNKVKHIIAGGKERQQSISNGLKVVNNHTDIVLVHDGARPFVSVNQITNLIEYLMIHPDQGAILGSFVKNTIKIVNDEGIIISTPSRDTLIEVHTPQGFYCDILKKAYQLAELSNYCGTDDASLVEKFIPSVQIKFIADTYKNIKITTPEDLLIGELFCKS